KRCFGKSRRSDDNRTNQGGGQCTGFQFTFNSSSTLLQQASHCESTSSVLSIRTFRPSPLSYGAVLFLKTDEKVAAYKLFGEPGAKTKPDTFKSGSPGLIAYHVSPPLL